MVIIMKKLTELTRDDLVNLRQALDGYDAEERLGPMDDIIERRLLNLVSTIEEDDKAFILVRRVFGIGCEKEPFKQIAAEQGVFRERLRQIIEKKRRRLRHTWSLLIKKERIERTIGRDANSSTKDI